MLRQLRLYGGLVNRSKSLKAFKSIDSNDPCLRFSGRGSPLCRSSWAWNFKSGCSMVRKQHKTSWAAGRCRHWKWGTRATPAANAGSAWPTNKEVICHPNKKQFLRASGPPVDGHDVGHVREVRACRLVVPCRCTTANHPLMGFMSCNEWRGWRWPTFVDL